MEAIFQTLTSSQAFWVFIAIFTGVALIMCAVGFKKFVWFLSVGYGLAVVGLGIGYLVTGFVSGYWDIILIVQCILLMIYGGRLSLFLLIREIKNATYRKVLKEATNEDKPMPFFLKFFIWVICAFLYVMQTSPIFSRIFNNQLWIPNGSGDYHTYVLPIIGIVISIIGIIIESVADKQKSNQKKINPNMVATKGLYKMVRCPNYFGEILFWTGIFVGSVTTLKTPGQWILASLGYVCIVYIMINGSQRLDRRQEKNYGEKEEYRNYADHTPLIFPLLPIYHIGAYKVEDVEAKKQKRNKKEKK